jgi:hypothetical protein
MMAQLINTFTSQKGRPPTHPWSEWADGKARRLFKGKDFEGELVSMRTMVHRKARDMGKRAYTRINLADQSIEVQFYDPES